MLPVPVPVLLSWFEVQAQRSKPGESEAPELGATTPVTATTTVTAFLPVLLAFHEFLSHRPAQVESDEPEDMWGSFWEDFKAWVVTSPTTLLLSTIIFSYGSYLGLGLGAKSTYFCSAVLDQRSVVILFQCLGVAIDATIIVMLWRALCWARTTRARLRMLCRISLLSALAVGFLWLATQLFQDRSAVDYQPLWGFDSIYFFDILGTGIVLGSFLTSTTLWICESSPLTPVAISSFVLGTSISVHSILLLGTYQQIMLLQPIFSLTLLSSGFTVFLYANNMRSVVVIGRAFLILLLIATLAASAILAPLKSKAMDRHPVYDLVYKGRVSSDRWLRYASVSTSLNSAVREYKDRHNGRDPPPNFDKWFDFAQQRKSPIIDKFDQIEKDILPFRGMHPQRIRDGLEFLKGLPDVGVITIADGTAHHNQPSDASQKRVLDEAVSMISSFSEHLPSMSIAINLAERPRVLVPWEDIQSMTKSGSSKSPFALLPNNRLQDRRVMGDTTTTPDNNRNRNYDRDDGSIMNPPESTTSESFVPAQTFRHLQALTCRPGSPSRARVPWWNVRDFCAACAAPHSQGEFLSDWPKSLDLCHQPDLFALHDFFTTPHGFDLYHDELLPLFSRSKTGGFNDILIPLVRPDEDYDGDGNGNEHAVDPIAFDGKLHQAFWQGNISDTARFLTHQSLRGGHTQRLVHLANNASAADHVPVIIGYETTRDTKDKQVKFHYEDVPAQAINGHLPLSFSFAHSSSGSGSGAGGPCETEDCLLMQREFGFAEPASPGKPLYSDKRYAVLLDGPDGPPRDLLRALRSNSVPVVSSIFREWYTERLAAWVHFVPVDPRYHGLHSTLAYFAGLKYRGYGAGSGGSDGEQGGPRPQVTESRKEDARWIAAEGRKWARRAVRREDMEVYLFRLLLEWGTVVAVDG
ncbi:hypothetical protein SLS62_006876 [Diatrype stigma]|uniref:Glycosyl transferase CAP10 domain-containing protein n=1 Tax=Diatrype stigma TaxID=117547 RepID=A0AAN9UQ15_9PEZI